MRLAYYDSTQRVSHPFKGRQRVAKSELEFLENGNAGQKSQFSGALMSFFSPLSSDRESFIGLNESLEPNVLYSENNFRYVVTPFPLWYIKCRKSENRFFL